MSDTTDQPAKQQPTFSTPQMVAIEAELAAKRSQLASDVDELVARLDPRAQAGRAVESGRQLWADATASDGDPATRKRAVTVLGGAIAGVVAVVGLITVVTRRKS